MPEGRGSTGARSKPIDGVWANRDVWLAAVKFSKISLLHRYIYAMIAVEHRRSYRKDAGLYDAEEITRIEGVLAAYEITHE